jgi:hypothetical protein
MAENKLYADKRIVTSDDRIFTIYALEFPENRVEYTIFNGGDEPLCEREVNYKSPMTAKTLIDDMESRLTTKPEDVINGNKMKFAPIYTISF